MRRRTTRAQFIMRRWNEAQQLTGFNLLHCCRWSLCSRPSPSTPGRKSPQCQGYSNTILSQQRDSAKAPGSSALNEQHAYHISLKPLVRSTTRSKNYPRQKLISCSIMPMDSFEARADRRYKASITSGKCHSIRVTESVLEGEGWSEGEPTSRDVCVAHMNVRYEHCNTYKTLPVAETDLIGA